ncbi:transporter [Myxococcus sp. RHSTA-1-4]|uniref:SphA family protein n=1 Tax=Myxococcus sp. RHSTA-1-4 TaxID=2874601 RepID=UPI001CBB8E59|nr:transporter [Myxococcus sp. RHSTA-1-4]MBZ4420667.1 transporter [Myxococcus sp. RHSTA-1-4]
MTGSARTFLGSAFAALGVLLPAAASAQELGHKIPGGIGVDAGVQQGPGVYVGDRLLWYSASQLRDRYGELQPVQGFDLDAVANAVGVNLTVQWPGWPYLGATVAVPLARISVNSEDPRASVDRFGLGDVYVMPVHLGWRLPLADLVASYGVYIPTGWFEARGGSGVGSGHWTHQFSLGGAVFFDEGRRARASALVSYDHNLRKRGIDITRGDTIQVQGGAGALVLRGVDVGVAGYALWQVRDDTGEDVPEVLRGARDRVFGLGPEVNVLIPKLKAKVGARYEWDFGTRSRPQGGLLVMSLSFLVWQPE